MLILLLFNYFEAQWWPTSKIKFSCVSSCHVCVSVSTCCCLVRNTIISLSLVWINNLSDVLTQLIFVKMCAKLEFLKKVRESHVDINTHTVIIPLLSILYKTFIVKEVGFCRLKLFTEVAATVRVIKGVTMKESILWFCWYPADSLI